MHKLDALFFILDICRNLVDTYVGTIVTKSSKNLIWVDQGLI